MVWKCKLPKMYNQKDSMQLFWLKNFLGALNIPIKHIHDIEHWVIFQMFLKKSINQVQQWCQDFELTFIDSADNKSTKGEMAPRLRTIFRPSGWKHILCNAPAALAWSFSSFDEINSTYIIICFLHTWEIINNRIEPWITMV